MDWLYACFLFFSWFSEGQSPANLWRTLDRNVADWLHVASWVSEADGPDDCWTILDYDLAEWPEGVTAVGLCMNRFPLHYEQLAYPHCDRWEDLRLNGAERRAIAKITKASHLELLAAVVQMRCKKVKMTRREELLLYAERQKATREAEWQCCFATLEDNLRRMKRGLREIDEYHYCWDFAGGDGWKKYYEGPK